MDPGVFCPNVTLEELAWANPERPEDLPCTLGILAETQLKQVVDGAAELTERLRSRRSERLELSECGERVVAKPSALRWSIETETRIRHTSLSPKALPRNSSRVAGGVHRRWTASSHTRTYRFRVKRDTPRSPYAARFSVMTGRCFLPCRNSSLTCTAPLVDSIGAGGEAQGNVLGQRGRGSNLGCSHAGERSR